MQYVKASDKNMDNEVADKALRNVYINGMGAPYTLYI